MSRNFRTLRRFRPGRQVTSREGCVSRNRILRRFRRLILVTSREGCVSRNDFGNAADAEVVGVTSREGCVSRNWKHISVVAAF